MNDLKELAEMIAGAVNDGPSTDLYQPAALVHATSEMAVLDIQFRGKRFKVVVSEAVG